MVIIRIVIVGMILMIVLFLSKIDLRCSQEPLMCCFIGNRIMLLWKRNHHLKNERKFDVGNDLVHIKKIIVDINDIN